MINALEAHIRDRAARIADDAVAKGGCDFVVAVAAELPLQAIAELRASPWRTATSSSTGATA